MQDFEQAQPQAFDIGRRLAPLRATLAIRRFDDVFNLLRIGRHHDHVLRLDQPGQPRPGERLDELIELLFGVEVGLVQDQQDRFVAHRQGRQGGILRIVQIGVGHEQDDIGPLRGIVGHAGP